MTTPKLPPPPRSAQNRSGCSSALGVDLRAVGEDHVGADQAVDRQAEAPRQVAEAAAEREPADAGRRDDPRRRRAAVLGRRPVDLTPGAAAADADGVGVGIDHDLGDAGEVDDHAVVDDAEPAAVVSATAHGDRPVVARANAMVRATSSGLVQRTISAGCRSIMALWTARASS